ncbi:MAG: hypothetical protein ACUVT7_01790 [Thermoplasmata archaeon]
MKLEELLQDRTTLVKLVWLAFISSLVFIGIGLYIMIRDIVG